MFVAVTELRTSLKEVINGRVARKLELTLVTGPLLLVVSHKLPSVADAAPCANHPVASFSLLILADGCATYHSVCSWHPSPVHHGRSDQFEKPFIDQTLDNFGNI